MKTPELEIAELRAKAEALAAAREERAAAFAAEAAYATAARDLEDEIAIDKAEADHGPIDKKIAVVKTDYGAVIVKRAHPAIFKRFLDRGKTDTKSLEELVRQCLVHPTLADWESFCEQQTMILIRCANAVSVLHGVRTEDISGKS